MRRINEGGENIRAFSRHRRPWERIGILALGILLGTSVSALASHQFSDVPTSALYHDAAEWLFNRGITLGCAMGLFCPNDFVTRAQMALFMQRLGGALSPLVIQRSDVVLSTIDLDTNPVVCATTVDYTPSFPQRAVIHARVSATPTSGMSYWVAGAYSTDAGVNWDSAFPTVAYRFGMRLGRGSGSGIGDIAEHRCALFVEVVNRNPTSSPLGGPARSAPQQRR